MKQMDIEMFLKIVECGSLSGASKELYIGQPTISSRIKMMEDELGVRLFERGRGIKKIQLTADGERFMPYAVKWKKLWQSMQMMLKGDAHINMTVSACSSIANHIMPIVYPLVRHKMENITLRLWQYHYQETFKLVENNAADIGFVTNLKFSKELEVFPLFKEKLVWIGSDPEQYGNPIRPEKLDNKRELYISWNEQYNQWHNYWFGEQSSIETETNSIAFIEPLLMQKGSWCIVPITVARILEKRIAVQIRELNECPEYYVTYLICKHSMAEYPVVKDILLEMKKTVEDLGAEWILDVF